MKRACRAESSNGVMGILLLLFLLWQQKPTDSICRHPALCHSCLICRTRIMSDVCVFVCCGSGLSGHCSRAYEALLYARLSRDWSIEQDMFVGFACGCTSACWWCCGLAIDRASKREELQSKHTTTQQMVIKQNELYYIHNIHTNNKSNVLHEKPTKRNIIIFRLIFVLRSLSFLSHRIFEYIIWSQGHSNCHALRQILMPLDTFKPAWCILRLVVVRFGFCIHARASTRMLNMRVLCGVCMSVFCVSGGVHVTRHNDGNV